jgi:acetylornithine deacetylase/succinyl-diaminopimelate desuccinylase-like protein
MAPELVARLVHGADERIAVDDLELAVDLYRRLAAISLE